MSTFLMKIHLHLCHSYQPFHCKYICFCQSNFSLEIHLLCVMTTLSMKKHLLLCHANLIWLVHLYRISPNNCDLCLKNKPIVLSGIDQWCKRDFGRVLISLLLICYIHKWVNMSCVHLPSILSHIGDSKILTPLFSCFLDEGTVDFNWVIKNYIKEMLQSLRLWIAWCLEHFSKTGRFRYLMYRVMRKQRM